MTKLTTPNHPRPLFHKKACYAPRKLRPLPGGLPPYPRTLQCEPTNTTTKLTTPNHPRPLFHKKACYAPRKPRPLPGGPPPYPRTLQREPVYCPLPIDSPPRFPQFQTIGGGALKREPAMDNSVSPEQQPSRIPAPIHAQGVAPRPAGVAAVYVVPRTVNAEEKRKRVRWRGWTDEKPRRRSGSGAQRHVNLKSILKRPPDANCVSSSDRGETTQGWITPIVDPNLWIQQEGRPQGP
ncbi:hypothetical protein BDZ89DRAFT_1158474 [Hymenopellis radicata]|nr:hypothetical protein BDZ89DRAFT_1158474 [Hymenopellis radicata]